jgi:hypothetical protein
MVNPTVGAANLQWVGVALEAVYGTAQATPTLFIPCDTPVWHPVFAELSDGALRGSMATEYQSINGLRYDTVTFKTMMYLDSVFFLLRSALGLPDVLTGASDPYTHKTSLQSGNNGQPAGTTVFFYDAQGKSWQMPGAQIQTLKITGDISGLVSVDITYAGLPAVPITPPSNTPTVAKPMPSWNSTISIAGVANTAFSAFDITITRASEMIPTITGTQSPFAIFGGPVTVAAGYTAVYQGSTDVGLVNYLTNVQPAIVITVSPQGDAVHNIKFQMTAVTWTDAAPAGTNKWMEIKGTLKALANPTDVAGGGNLSPLLVTMLSPVATVI